MVYTKEQVETSFRALAELAKSFNKNKNLRGKFVLAGGWAPYFITLGKFDHTGSRDVDLVLSLEIMKIYANIVRLMTEILKYSQTGPFEFTRTDSDITFEVHFMCEPKHIPPNTWTYRIQRGLSPFIVEGCTIVFEDNLLQEVDGTEILVCGPVASISLKVHSFSVNESRIKDPYDIYAIMSSVDDIAKILSLWAKKNTFVEESIELLRGFFDSETAAGPAAAAEYLITVPSERGEYAARVFSVITNVLKKIS